jgi:hypothetical protein
MVEKKYSRISVRVPQSWKRTCREKGISISFVCRAALFQAMQQSEKAISIQSTLRSKQQAAALYNSLKNYIVRTINPVIESELIKNHVKLYTFRDFFISRATGPDLILLAEFLGQEEYAEQVLQEIYI